MDEAISSENGAYEWFLRNVIDDSKSIVAEIVRLRDFIPPDFENPSVSVFKDIIFDFKYFSKVDYYENLLHNHEKLQDDFYSKFGNVLSKFEVLFNAIGNLIPGYVEFTLQIGKDNCSHSIDLLRELEVLSLSSVSEVILHLHKLISGPTRERIFVSIYRNSDDRTHLHFLLDFLRQTSGQDIVSNEFSRLGVGAPFVDSCVSFFEKLVHHKKQGSLVLVGKHLSECLFACLLFSPRTLESENNKMRFFVEHYFREYWVLSMGLGLLLSLSEEWSPRSAAKAALHKHFTSSRLKDLYQQHISVVADQSLFSVSIQPDKFAHYADELERYNGSFKWLALHTHPELEESGDTFIQTVDFQGNFREKAVDFVLKLGHFEIELRKVFSNYIKQRTNVFLKTRKEICDLINEISDLFVSGFPTLKLQKRDKLRQWLLMIKETLENLNMDDPENVAVIQQIKRRFLQVGDILDLGEHMVMAHFLDTVTKNLDLLITCMVTDADCDSRFIQAAESSYMWPLIDSWLTNIQRRVLKSTKSQCVRILFMKLALSISSYSNSVFADNRKELISRAYSCYLERRLRNVLQSIPNHLFKILHEKIVPVLHSNWSSFMDKIAIRENAEFKNNFKLSEITYTICNMSIGISKMSIKKLGTIDINPKELLTEGMRKELKSELPKLFYVPVNVMKEKNLDLKDLLPRLSDIVNSFVGAFVYVCEHIGVAGYKLWTEELDDFVQNIPQISALPRKINEPQPVFNVIYSFISKSTDVATTSYFENEMTWKDKKTQKETFSSKFTDEIEKYLPSVAISVLEKKVSEDIADVLQKCCQDLSSISSLLSGFSVEDLLVQPKKCDQIVKIVLNNQPMFANISLLGKLVHLHTLLLQSKRNNSLLQANQISASISASNAWLLSDPQDMTKETTNVAILSHKMGFCHANLQKFSLGRYNSSSMDFSLISTIMTVLLKRSSKKDLDCDCQLLTGCSFILFNLPDSDSLQRVHTISSAASQLVKKFKLQYNHRQWENSLALV